MKQEIKTLAIELRKQNLTITEIAKQLKVAKSSIYNWTKNIKVNIKRKINITINHRERLKDFSERCKQKRLSYQENGRNDINRNHWEHAAGCMLWWGEGSKNKHNVSVTNCDVDLLKFFMFFLRKYYLVENKDIYLYIQHHGNIPDDEIINYWKKQLSLEDITRYSLFKKPKKSSKTKHKYGICRITVGSTKIVNQIWGSVQEYIGFEKEGLY